MPRIAHPAADGDQRTVLSGWIAGNVTDDQVHEVLPAVDRFLIAKAVTSAAEAIGLVPGFGRSSASRITNLA